MRRGNRRANRRANRRGNRRAGPDQQADLEVVDVETAHLDERLDLFMVIVLGEAVSQLVLAGATTPWTGEFLRPAALGFLALVGLWWLTFSHGFAATPHPGWPRWLRGSRLLCISRRPSASPALRRGSGRSRSTPRATGRGRPLGDVCSGLANGLLTLVLLACVAWAVPLGRVGRARAALGV
ncbi:MAG: low temperature requirement protein A [Nocardioidaceae bacterium]